MINNSKIQKFISATMLAAFVVLAANPVIVQAQEHTKAMQDKAVATAQADAKFSETKINLESGEFSLSSINMEDVSNLILKNQGTTFSTKEMINTAYEKTQKDDWTNITRYASSGDKSDFFEISFGTNTQFSYDADYLNDFTPTVGQKNLVDNIVGSLNSTFSEGYFSTPVALEIKLDNAKHFEVVSDIQADLQAKIDANILKEQSLVEKAQELISVKEQLKDPYSLSSKQIFELSSKKNFLKNAVDSSRNFSTDFLKAVQKVAPDGKGVKLIDSTNYSDQAVFPTMTGGSCIIQMHGDSTGIKSSHNYNPLIYQNVENDVTVQLIAEQHTIHEASHCHYEVQNYKIDTGNPSLDTALTKIFLEDSNADFNLFRAQMHENFADTYTHMIMLKKYGLDNPDLNKLGDLFTQGRSFYKTSHQTSVAWKIINQPEIRQQIMESSPEALSTLANQIASQTVVANLAHNTDFQRDLMDNQGLTPFDGANVKSFQIALMKSSGIMSNTFSDGLFKERVDSITNHLDKMAEADSTLSAAIKVSGLYQSSLTEESDASHTSFEYVANKLWSNTEYKAEFMKQNQEFNTSLQQVIKDSASYIPPMLKTPSGTLSQAMSKINDTITLKDIKESLSSDHKKETIFNVITGVAKYDSSISQVKFKDMLKKYEMNGEYQLNSLEYVKISSPKI